MESEPKADDDPLRKGLVDPESSGDLDQGDDGLPPFVLVRKPSSVPTLELYAQNSELSMQKTAIFQESSEHLGQDLVAEFRMEPMKLNEKLKRLCGKRRWGQSDLSKAIGGASKSSMNNWFSGKFTPDLGTALKMARALEVPLDWLADDEVDYPPEIPEPKQEAEPSAILKLVEALSLSEQEALRRLATPVPEPKREPEPPITPHYGPPPGYEHGSGRPLGVRRETEAFARTIQDRNAPKPSVKGKDKAESDRRGRPKGKSDDAHKGSESKQ